MYPHPVLNQVPQGVHTIIVAYGADTNSVKAVPATTVGKLTLEKPKAAPLGDAEGISM